MNNKLNKLNNKVTYILHMLNLFMISTLLNSCGGIINGKTDADDGRVFKKTSKQCPVCKGGCRYLYKLTDKKHSIVLMCEECNAVWSNPTATNWEDVVSDNKLSESCNVDEVGELFRKGAAWATKAEGEKSNQWKKFAQVTEGMFIKG